MKKMLYTLAAALFVLCSGSGEARAANCPGAPPWSFVDVDATDPFCPFVTEMALRGVSVGCETIDATRRRFCPGSPVSRLQMAAFLTRLPAPLRLARVRAGNFRWTTSGLKDVPLDDAGATTLTWLQAADSQRLLTYSAECALTLPAAAGTPWVHLDIVVNGEVIPPTQGDADAFCGVPAGTTFSGYQRPSITLLIDARAGENQVSIRAGVGADGITVSLGDSSLVID